jgi:hypothetical protein
MTIRAVYGALILGGLVAATTNPTLSLAQSNNPGATAKDAGMSAQKDGGAPASKSATPNTNMNPAKHRYWRHRGGRHPHYGSRRVRT